MTSPEFYANARAYDIAFSDRDFADECNFLEWCLRTHGCVAADDSRSFIELACGPARHAREFARRGWRAVALDLSPDMLDYARQGAIRDGVLLETVAADMADFTLDRPVALAANLMESLSHMVTNEQVVAHLRSVSRSLLPGGVFVIEMAHPSTIWRDNLPNVWSSRSTDVPYFAGEPYTEVDVLFGAADDPYDWITQQWLVTARLTIRESGQPERVVEHRHPHRWYQAQELRALIELSGAFSKVWWYGDMLIPPPPLDNDAERMMVVLRK
ncbi:MAG: class I SAM-dependent methyltransferase [Thermoflexales bacterium]|nr:class I SAM-dependent methyltransferase [Thermoflexales bacterium]MDW8351110.1 class I SAM-dependent methyltransferase [Anaerolineae bacterium]